MSIAYYGEQYTVRNFQDKYADLCLVKRRATQRSRHAPSVQSFSSFESVAAKADSYTQTFKFEFTRHYLGHFTGLPP